MTEDEEREALEGALATDWRSLVFGEYAPAGISYLTTIKDEPGRWTRPCTAIFESSAGRRWGIEYREGLTEIQENALVSSRPFRVEAVEQQVTVTKYQRAKENA